MTVLPILPKKTKKTEKQILRFGGLDLRADAPEGCLTDSVGISVRELPTLIVCGGREKVEGYRSPTDMYAASGRLAVADGGRLCYDGRDLGPLCEGKKQFAVVGGRLCIFPDKIAVDIHSGEVTQLEKSLTADTNRNPTEITSRSVTVTPVRDKLQTDTRQQFNRTDVTRPFAYTCIYTYGRDKELLESCFSRGTWQGLDRIESLKDVCYNNTGSHLSEGDIVIPQVLEDGTVSLIGSPYRLIQQQGEWVIDPQYYPDRELYNRHGIYCVIKSVNTDLDRGADTEVTFDVYKTDGADLLVHNVFSVGDAVSITGTPYGIKDVSSVPVRETDTRTNSLIFDEGAIRECEHYCILTAPAAANTPLTMLAGGRYVTITPPEPLFAGTLLYMGGVYTGDTGTTQTKSITVYQWDESAGENAAAFDAEVTDSYIEDAVQTAVYPKNFGTLTVSRPLPDLDYICESDNRLWGLNRRENRVYASHWGRPDSFYPDGKEGGWSKTFGSEGEFTAICAFGGGVCCFKEGLLHKILGTTPGSYYVSDYTLPGVKQGCERSVQTISDTLCYRGVHGVYAYSGAAPKLISRELGDNLPDCAVSGTDGRMYYLSGLVGGNPVRYAYDTFGKVWIKEADEQAAAIACVGGTTYMLTDSGLYKIGSGDKSQSHFMAEFVPFCEDTFRKKCYTRLVFGITMAPDSTLRVYTRCDGGEYRLTYTHTPDSRCSLSIPIRVQRCSRFGIRLEGRGDVTITGLAREFALLSEV